MTITRHTVLDFPFNPVRSFTALACGDETITLKDPAMFDLIGAINSSRKTYEAGVSIRGAIAAGGETDGLVADLHARFAEQATAMGYLIDRIEAPATDDEAARLYAEGHGMQEAAE